MADLRDAYRSLRAAPGLFLFAALSLGLGIGASSGLFTIVDGLVLRNLPVEAPASLAVVTHAGESGRHYWATYPAWEAWKDAELFEETFAWWSTPLDTADGGIREPVDGIVVSANFFDAIGARTALGRGFEAMRTYTGERGCRSIELRVLAETFRGRPGRPRKDAHHRARPVHDRRCRRAGVLRTCRRRELRCRASPCRRADPPSDQ